MRQNGYAALIFLLLCAGCSYAENRVDTRISEILSIISDKQSNIESYTVDMEAYEGDNLVFAGVNKYKKPNFSRIDGKLVGEDEATIIVVCDGIFKWTYYPFASMVIKEMVSVAGKNLSMRSGVVDIELKSYVTINEDGTKVSYNISYYGESEVNDIPCYVLDTEKHIEVSDIEKYTFTSRIFFNKKTGMIVKIQSHDDKKENFEIFFNNYDFEKVANSYFEFQVPSEAIVNDLTTVKGSVVEMRGIF